MEEGTVSLEGPDELIAEVERMRSITRRHSAGELSSGQLPRDVHTYYGRIQEGERELARLKAGDRKEGQMPGEQDRHKAVSEHHNTQMKTRPDGSAVDGAQVANVVRELVVLMNNEAGRIDREWRNVRGQNLDEAMAATNHYRGQASAWNRMREEVLNRHPESKKDMPQRIDVEQIRVQQNLIIEQELAEHRQAVSTR